MKAYFYTSEEFDIHQFVASFRENYDKLYDGAIKESSELVEQGLELLKTHSALAQMYSEAAHDYPISDRELSAFAVTFDEFRTAKARTALKKYHDFEPDGCSFQEIAETFADISFDLAEALEDLLND